MVRIDVGMSSTAAKGTPFDIRGARGVDVMERESSYRGKSGEHIDPGQRIKRETRSRRLTHRESKRCKDADRAMDPTVHRLITRNGRLDGFHRSRVGAHRPVQADEMTPELQDLQMIERASVVCGRPASCSEIGRIRSHSEDVHRHQRLENEADTFPGAGGAACDEEKTRHHISEENHDTGERSDRAKTSRNHRGLVLEHY